MLCNGLASRELQREAGAFSRATTPWSSGSSRRHSSHPARDLWCVLRFYVFAKTCGSTDMQGGANRGGGQKNEMHRFRDPRIAVLRH